MRKLLLYDICMYISEEQMRSLDYSYMHVVIVFNQCQSSDGMHLFYDPCCIAKECAMLDVNDTDVVPCYKVIGKTSGGVDIVCYKHGTRKVKKDYGTYEIVPQVIHRSDLDAFYRVPGKTYIFEGFFSNKFKMTREFSKKLMKYIKKLSYADSFIDDAAISKLKLKIDNI